MRVNYVSGRGAALAAPGGFRAVAPMVATRVVQRAGRGIPSDSQMLVDFDYVLRIASAPSPPCQDLPASVRTVRLDDPPS